MYENIFLAFAVVAALMGVVSLAVDFDSDYDDHCLP